LRSGYICGGLSNDYIGLSAPFEITFCLLVASTFFTAFCLPYIPPGGFPANKDPNSTTEDLSEEEPKKDASTFVFLRCLRIFLPAKYADGKGTFWGLPLLGFGAFWSVMATAYVVCCYILFYLSLSFLGQTASNAAAYGDESVRI
jgi:hypothetical protein